RPWLCLPDLRPARPYKAFRKTDESHARRKPARLGQCLRLPAPPPFHRHSFHRRGGNQLWRVSFHHPHDPTSGAVVVPSRTIDIPGRTMGSTEARIGPRRPSKIPPQFHTRDAKSERKSFV